MRLHVNGNCTLCYPIKTGEIPKGSTVEKLHRAVTVFGALPTPRSSLALLEVLEGLRIHGDNAAPIFALLCEILERCYPQSTDLERIKDIEDEIRTILDSLPDKKTSSLNKSQRPRLKYAIDLIHTVRRGLLPNMRIRARVPPIREETGEPVQEPESVTSSSLKPEASRRRETETGHMQVLGHITTPPSSPNLPGGNVTSHETHAVGGATMGNKRKRRTEARQPQEAAIVHRQKKKRTSKTTKTGDVNVEREDNSTQGRTGRGVRVAAMREESPMQVQTDGSAGFSLYGRRRRPRRLT